MCSIRVDTDTILLILFAGLIDVCLLGLFGLELLLDSGLERLLVVHLPCMECCGRRLKISTNLLGEDHVEARLLVRLEPDRIQGIPQLSIKTVSAPPVAVILPLVVASWHLMGHLTGRLQNKRQDFECIGLRT